mgnify:CR=1 FL=1
MIYGKNVQYRRWHDKLYEDKESSEVMLTSTNIYSVIKSLLHKKHAIILLQSIFHL